MVINCLELKARVKAKSFKWMRVKSIAGYLPAGTGTHLSILKGQKAQLAQAGKKFTQISSNLGRAGD